MKITRDNYESWFIDYLEGKLDEEMMDEFIRFILENPDLKEELNSYEPVTLNRENFAFPGKDRLYKDNYDLPEVFENTAIALMEGDLDDSSVAEFTNYLLTHPEKKKDAELFRYTKLIPDLSATFRAKNRLIHHPVLSLYTRQLLRIAALLVMAVLLFPILNTYNHPGDPEKISDLTVTNPVPEKQDAVNLAENSIPDSFVPETPKREKINQNPGRSVQSKIQSKPSAIDADNKTITIDTRVDFPGVLTVSDQKTLALLPMKEPEIVPYVFEIEYYTIAETRDIPLSTKIAEKTGLRKITLDKIARFGLDLVTDLSKEKFNYTSTPEGEIIAYNLDTRLVGFSIPAKK